jgi:NAD(P)H-hydrate epimerase
MPALTRAQLQAVDRLASERYAIPSIVLMENAARQAADAIVAQLPSETRALIVCGGGNNGGDGLATARHLHIRGWDVTILTTIAPEKYKGDALANYQIIQSMTKTCANLRLTADDPIKSIRQWDGGVIVDAIFGTGLDQPPRDPFPQIAEAINEASSHWGANVVALDLPSGLDCDTGKPLGPAIVQADFTVTFAAQKKGFATPGATAYTGRVILADIGAPPELIEQVFCMPG